MKKMIIIGALALSALGSFAQTIDLRHKIEVTGTAEQEITPDIIYVAINLQEYMDGKTKISISDLESQLENAVNAAGIPKEDLTINNLSAYNYTYQKKKNPDFLANKQYYIKFHDLIKFNQIISKIDPKGIQSTRIDRTEYSKITELKREVLTRALQAAKDKATYLLAAIGEHLGNVIEINEVDTGNNQTVFRSANLYSNSIVAGSPDGDVPDSDISIKKIKLQFQVHTVFEIAAK